MIELKEITLRKEHPTPIIDHVDLSVNKGEFVVLCGESGSGKSTLLRILNGLIPELYDGKLQAKGEVFGQDFMTKDFNQYVKHIGVVFQNPKTQFFTSDVYSELAFAMENYGVSRQEMLEKIDTISTNLDLNQFLDRSMFSLSGGQKQLIAFASASMLSHKLFLLDEPSSNLDESTIEKLRQYLWQLKQQGMTIIIAEHRLYYLTDLVDRYLLMDKGQVKREISEEEMSHLSEEKVASLGLRSLKKKELIKAQHDESREFQYELVISDLIYGYKKQQAILNIPNIRLDNSRIIGIVGENGAGKTTFSKIVSGLIKTKTGMIQFNGKPMTRKDLIRESFVVMQDVNLQLFFETVEKELLLNAKHIDKFKEVVDMLSLQPLLMRHPQTLSGGEKQRVAIASAVLSGKKIVIFDEPTSGLDLVHMQEVSRVIKWLEKQEILILVITHDKEFIEQTCERIIHFAHGEVIDDYIIEKKSEE